MWSHFEHVSQCLNKTTITKYFCVFVLVVIIIELFETQLSIWQDYNTEYTTDIN